MRLQFDGAYAGSGGSGHFFEAHPAHLQHAHDFALAGRQNCDQFIEIGRRGAGLALVGAFRKRGHGLLPQTNPLRAPVAVDSYMTGYRVDPRQHRLAWPVGMAGLVNLQPCVLEQVLSFRTASVLACKKS